jgi:hypothetical protein
VEHLGHLRVVDLVFAVCSGVSGVCLLVLTLLFSLISITGDAGVVSMVPTLGLGCMLACATLTAAVLLAVAGRGLPEGRGRLLQSLLAVGALPSLPFGTAFGLYSLWVCWGHEDSRAIFEAASGSEQPQ